MQDTFYDRAMAWIHKCFGAHYLTQSQMREERRILSLPYEERHAEYAALGLTSSEISLFELKVSIQGMTGTLNFRRDASVASYPSPSNEADRQREIARLRKQMQKFLESAGMADAAGRSDLRGSIPCQRKRN